MRIEGLLGLYGHKCVYCGRRVELVNPTLSGRAATKDHDIPKCRYRSCADSAKPEQ